MPMCVVCGSMFYYQTRLDPHESCDCGRDWSALADMDDPESTATYRTQWAAALADEVNGAPDSSDLTQEQIDRYDTED